jgi:hypothetical protein
MATLRTARPEIFAAAALTLLAACRGASNDGVSSDPEGRKKATSASATSAPTSPPSPKDEEPAGALVVTMTPAPQLEVGGRPLRLGMKSIELTGALGRPSGSTDYGADEGAMSNTTYVRYAKLGVIVRIKANLVEGFYVYLHRLELDGQTMEPAKPALPGGLSLDATLDDVERAMGKPTKRDVVDVMHWIDLVYERAGARVKFHFENDAFASVSIETITI